MDGSKSLIRYPHETPPENGAAIEVAEGVLWIRLPLPMALDHVNVYALDEGDGWTLIDAGINTRKCRAAMEAAMAGPLAGKPITRVVLTHHHPDHVGLAGWLTDLGAELLMPRTAYLLTRMLTMDEQPNYSAHNLAFYRRNGMAAEVLKQRETERPFNFADCVLPLPAGYTRICDGETITMGERTWDIRMGDGHAPEHATFWSRDDALVLSGDQLLPSISPNIGVYPTEPDGDPLGEWLRSCRQFAQIASHEHFVLGGHKLPYYGLPTRLQQLIENHEGALSRIEEHLSTPRVGGDCFIPLFKREITGDQYGLAFVETVAHLNHLLKQGRVTREMGPDGAWLWQRV